MKSLDDLRKEINQIDQAFLELFIKRINVSKEIGAYKKANKIPVFDQKREQDNLNQQRIILNDDRLWALYQPLYQHLMDISKEVQK